MGVMLRDLPEDDLPRERLIKYGAACLSDVDLLAILLRTGVKGVSVFEVAQNILSLYKGIGLSAMMHMEAHELAQIHGVGLAKAASILAAVELGRRLSLKAAQKKTAIHGPEDVANYAMPQFLHEQSEHFAVLLLDAKSRILGMPEISSGGLSVVLLNPREVFRHAFIYSASSMILLHNHPSGDPNPSKEDYRTTKRMIEAGKILGVCVQDHVILGMNCFVSMRREYGEFLWKDN